MRGIVQKNEGDSPYGYSEARICMVTLWVDRNNIYSKILGLKTGLTGELCNLIIRTGREEEKERKRKGEESVKTQKE